MQKTKFLLIALLLVASITSNSVLHADNSDSKLHLGFVAGLAVPNDKVSQFYSESNQYFNIENIGGVGNYVTDKAASIGYTLGIKGRMALMANLDLVPTIGLTRFNEGDYGIKLPVGDTNWNANIKSVANVVNVGAGFNLYLIKSFLSPYITAGLNYNYMSYSCDYVWWKGFSVPVNTKTVESKSKESENSLGYALGAGLDIDISLFSLNFEARWHTLNIIKKNSAAPNKNHVTFTVGVVF